MTPTTHLRADVFLVAVGGGAEEHVVHALRVGLDVPGEALEEVLHRGARLLRDVLEEDVLLVEELDEEVAAAAGLLLLRVPAQRLHQDARGVGGDAERRLQRVLLRRGE